MLNNIFSLMVNDVSIIPLFLEPVGFKAPAFPSIASTFTMFQSENSTIVLPCEAQAYPVPIFR